MHTRWHQASTVQREIGWLRTHTICRKHMFLAVVIIPVWCKFWVMFAYNNLYLRRATYGLPPVWILSCWHSPVRCNSGCYFMVADYLWLTLIVSHRVLHATTCFGENTREWLLAALLELGDTIWGGTDITFLHRNGLLASSKNCSRSISLCNMYIQQSVLYMLYNLQMQCPNAWGSSTGCLWDPERNGNRFDNTLASSLVGLLTLKMIDSTLLTVSA